MFLIQEMIRDLVPQSRFWGPLFTGQWLGSLQSCSPGQSLLTAQEWAVCGRKPIRLWITCTEQRQVTDLHGPLWLSMCQIQGLLKEIYWEFLWLFEEGKPPRVCLCEIFILWVSLPTSAVWSWAVFVPVLTLVPALSFINVSAELFFFFSGGIILETFSEACFYILNNQIFEEI